MTRIAILLAGLVLLTGCIDPIDLDVGEPDRKLVVQGLVREGPGPHEVVLRRSGAFTQGINAIRGAEEGARVTVLVGDGSEVVLPMVTPGVYRVEAGVLVGAVGESYGLRIETADGTVYEAAPQVMQAAPEIAEFEVVVDTNVWMANGVLVEEPQVSLFVRPEPTPGEAAFYRWTWRGIARVEVCPFLGSPACGMCYVSTNSRTQVQVGDNTGTGPEGVPAQRAARFGVRDADARFLAQPFLVTVEQQAITPEVHAYLELIRETAERVGGLFDPPPDAAIGNVLNVEDPQDFALGVFAVAGVASRPICLSPSTIPNRPELSYPGPILGTCGGTVPGSPNPPPEYAATCTGG